MHMVFLLWLTTLSVTAAAAPVRDGRHDFDWEAGSWDTRLQRLVTAPGSPPAWRDYSGSTLVRPALGGSANLAELDVTGPAGRIAGVSLRLYHPDSGQWSLHFANLASGEMGEPMHGSFVDGRGAFYGTDTVLGQRVLLRFLIVPLGDSQWRFEQAYSTDGARTWQANWIAVDTRRAGAVPDQHRSHP